MAEVKIPLAQTIDAVRRELEKSVKSAAGEKIQFPVGEITLEFQVGVTQAGEGSLGIQLWVFGLGGKGSHSQEHMQKVTITLGAPVDDEDRPIRVVSGSMDEPG